MRPKPIATTDEGVVYERPDGTRYVQPYRQESKRAEAQNERPPPNPRRPGDPAWLYCQGARPVVKLRLLRYLAARRADRVDQLAELLRRESSGVYRHCYDLMHYGLIQRRPDKGLSKSGQSVYCYSITRAGRELLKRWNARDDV